MKKARSTYVHLSPTSHPLGDLANATVENADNTLHLFHVALLGRGKLFGMEEVEPVGVNGVRSEGGS
jgi:hypothetical protein